MYNAGGSSPTIGNCIFWPHVSDDIFNDDPIVDNPTISYSNLYSGLPAGTIDGGGNIDLFPFFVDARGPDNIPGTEDDNLRLQVTSPCIDAGDNTTFGLVGVLTDLDGNDRFHDTPSVPDTGNGIPPIVNMGAYESQCGNGFVDAFEECDDGGESAICDADCTITVCGDGTINAIAGEQCEDGGETITCDSDCTFSQCGDGTQNVTAGEDCDDGDANNNNNCTNACLNAVCSDGIVWDQGSGTEECDDGNTQSNDGCDAICHLEPQPIPTVSAWGLTVTTLLLLIGAKIRFRRHEPT